MITIDDFSKIEIRVGKVSEASNVEGSEKLIRLVVDFGEPEKRIIFTGNQIFIVFLDFFKYGVNKKQNQRYCYQEENQNDYINFFSACHLIFKIKSKTEINIFRISCLKCYW